MGDTQKVRKDKANISQYQRDRDTNTQASKSNLICSTMMQSMEQTNGEAIAQGKDR